MENKDAGQIETRSVQAGVLQAYLARPGEGENLPAVIIIHEIFGLNDNMRDIARRFANEGYIALAVDLYSQGQRAWCIARVVLGLMQNPLNNFSMYNLDGAVKYLQAQPGVASEQIGVIGFCLGGGYALAFAVHSSEVRAASIFYGANPRPLSSLVKACPIAASYGEKDPVFSKAGKKLEETMRQFDLPVDMKIYPDAGHSFFNDTLKTYRPEAAADAWQRTLSWFQQYLPTTKG
jgi:carboxymethylenebutenolidase